MQTVVCAASQSFQPEGSLTVGTPTPANSLYERDREEQHLVCLGVWQALRGQWQFSCECADPCTQSQEHTGSS